MTIHNITRPGATPQRGDIVEFEYANGYVMRVDPHTMQSTKEPRRFVCQTDGSYRPL